MSNAVRPFSIDTRVRYDPHVDVDVLPRQPGRLNAVRRIARAACWGCGLLIGALMIGWSRIVETGDAHLDAEGIDAIASSFGLWPGDEA